MAKQTDQIRSRVNFEAWWQGPPATVRPLRQPALLADKRVVKRPPRILAEVLDKPRIATKPIVGKVLPRTVPPRPGTRKQQIVTELGVIFSTCTFNEAREIINYCTDREEQFLLATFLRQHGWQQTRLGREIAPRLRTTR